MYESSWEWMPEAKYSQKNFFQQNNCEKKNMVTTRSCWINTPPSWKQGIYFLKEISRCFSQVK